MLEEKSQRLKQLTEDLVETSKITSGNVKLNMQKLDLVELLYQTGGEFNERFESRNLTIVTKFHQNRYLSMRMGVSFTALLKICILMLQNMHWKIPEYM